MKRNVTTFLMVCLAAAVLTGCGGGKLSAAREKSKRVKCFSSLSQLGKIMMMYSMDYNDKYPGSLKELVEYMKGEMKMSGDDTAGLLVCPSSGHEAGDLRKIEEWSDYSLVKGRSAEDPGDAVLMYEKAGCHGGEGGNILFMDGTVQWHNGEDFNKVTQSLRQ